MPIWAADTIVKWVPTLITRAYAKLGLPVQCPVGFNLAYTVVELAEMRALHWYLVGMDILGYPRNALGAPPQLGDGKVVTEVRSTWQPSGHAFLGLPGQCYRGSHRCYSGKDLSQRWAHRGQSPDIKRSA